ncbi:hypothetical protein LMG26846_00057 [Achromobacter insuavis]|uniref:hypothetical protein n=1 Tax=Achromobacter insuavis TaxID=1287735 RepID=UPI0014654D6B|nr:hypothetical protein [Achromobacter insuavis]CAB3814313.1 hypothetical protein LMG26846_00057 [Achromobacter insuavis]
MSDSKYPNHGGGTLEVVHGARWGAVPEALLEDKRLGLDTRGTAAWLAIKPTGWKIIIEVLCNRLDITRGRWQRIARELQEFGYLQRDRVHGSNGQWIWMTSFSPVPTSGYGETIHGPAGNGPASSGPASNGRITHGSSIDGKPRHKSSGSKECLLRTRTTTTPTLEPENSGARKRAQLASASPKSETSQLREDGQVASTLELEPCVQHLQDAFARALLGIDPSKAQEIVDEFTGNFERAAEQRRKPIASPIHYIQELIKRSEQGAFVPQFGPLVKRRREQRQRQNVPTDSPRARTPEDTAAMEAAIRAARSALASTAATAGSRK